MIDPAPREHQPPPAVRLLRAFARGLGLEGLGRALYHKWTRPRSFAEDEARQLAELDTRAAAFGSTVQRLMDIHPASRWFQPRFHEEFGGFQPPGQSRSLNGGFPHDRVRSDFLTLLLQDITARNVPGALAELGVHRGTSARLLHHYCPERRLYLFDTFKGFDPQDFEKESIKVAYNQAQQFTDTSVAVVLETIAPVNQNVVPVVGWFPDSLPPELAGEKFALVHLDADLEAPTAAGLEFFWPRLSHGGFIVVHDYNGWPGARLAVSRFREAHAVATVPMPDKSGSVVLSKP